MTFDDGSFHAPLASSGNAGDTAQRAFTADGTFAYHCELHPAMRGTIVAGSGVAAPPPAPETSSSPTPAPTPSPTPSASPTPSPSPSPTPASPTPSPTPAPTPTPTPAAPSPVTINIQGFAFVGPTSVPVGTTVTWKNHDGAPHTATANDGSFDTGTLSQGQSASHTFDAAGSFPYFCEVHPSMTATLTVTA